MYLEYHTVVVLCYFFWFWWEIVFGVTYVLSVQYRCGCVSVFVVAGKFYYNRKKSSSRLSGGCAIVITTGKKSSSHLSGGLCCSPPPNEHLGLFWWEKYPKFVRPAIIS